MPIRHHACLSVTCDVCGCPLEDFEDSLVHVASVKDARTMARHYRWRVLSGDGFMCPDTDAAHQAAMDDLLPPEPAFQVPGQLDLDGNETP